MVAVQQFESSEGDEESQQSCTKHSTGSPATRVTDAAAMSDRNHDNRHFENTMIAVFIEIAGSK
jgi:hypothetical protein